MTRLLALSFDAPASPSITLKWQQDGHAGAAPRTGWGMAWYPPDESGAVVIKDPTSIGDDAMTALLRDWPRFRSTIFMGHLRGAARRIAQEDTHPFERRYAGRSWLLTHNGWLEHGYRDRLPLGTGIQEPVGHTDSEYVLCWLLSKLRRARARRLSDVGWDKLRKWFQQVNKTGTFNVVLADGIDLVAYQDMALFNPLHYQLRRPPYSDNVLANVDIVLDLSNTRDALRSGVIVTTAPLSPESPTASNHWQRLDPGQMIVARRGAVIWDSNGQATEVARRNDSPTVDPLPEPEPTVESAPRELTQVQAATQGLEPSGEPGVSQDQEQRRTYRIFHKTAYKYVDPVQRSTHLLRLRPAQDRLQELLAHDLSIFPVGRTSHYGDVFANEVVGFDLEAPYDSLEIVSTSTVRVHSDDHRTLYSPVRRSGIPLVWMPWQRQMMTPYLLPHELPEVQLRELFDYAMGFVERQDYDLTETLLDINRTIYRDYAYVQGSTTVETTPFEVYVSRRGVCQDFANLMICMARLLGVPARYRVGYIYTSKDYENTIQSDASHAWAELYLPWYGWQGFDPTNGTLAGLDHVRTACGRNYRDATPTSGTIFQGGGGEKLSIEVRVELVSDDGSC